MIPRKFDRILDDCLSRMDRGESLLEILAVYPAQAERIKPLLMAAMLSRAIPQPVPGYTALRMGKNQLLAEMASMQSEGSFIKPKPQKLPRESGLDRLARSLKQLQPAYRFAIVSMVVVLTGGFFTFSASASGLAENIMHTLFYGFEQVGDMLLVSPSPVNMIGDNRIFASDYDLPGSPDDNSDDFGGFLVEGVDNVQIDQYEEESLSQIQTPANTATDYQEEDEVIDENDLEKEEQEEQDDNEEEQDENEEEKDQIEEEKDQDIDEKEEEKDLKEDEKDQEKEEKEEEKDLKEDEKEEDEDDKEEEKDLKEEEKEAEKEEKEDEKDKDKDK